MRTLPRSSSAMSSTHSSSRWRSWETIRTAPSKSSIRCSSASRRDMSRCASGSSSSSSPGRRARQAASATSLRWPPLSSRVGRESASSSSPSAVRCARASLSARSPPSSDHCPSSRSWLASARSSLRMSPASAGSARRRSACASSRSSARQLGARVEHGGERGAAVALDDLRERGQHQPAAAGDRAGVRVLLAGEDAQQRRLAAAVGPEHADAGARGELQVERRRGSRGRRTTS